MRSLSVPVEGCTVTLTEEGRGLPPVFVHGAVTTRYLFFGLVGAFSPRVRGIAVDLRGYGDSGSSRRADGEAGFQGSGL